MFKEQSEHVFSFILHQTLICSVGFKRLYLPLHKVADTRIANEKMYITCGESAIISLSNVLDTILIAV